MINAPQTTDRLWHFGQPCPYDEVIDVRSPGEFAEDHIPGAVNLPVLNDAERIEVGTIFRIQGAFVARKFGAALVSANIALHLRSFLADREKDFRPLIYCWRGGQRSASLATVLAQVGWRVTVLQGGYKTYRQHVRRELDHQPPRFAFRVLSGATGSGKTRLLHALAARGASILDLEGLARHRGSILGGSGAQPSQKWFESTLLEALQRLDSEIPVWVEAESNRIGNVFLPRALWVAMQTAEGIELRVPIAGRVGHLLDDYPELRNDTDGLKRKLSQLESRHGPRQIERWKCLIDSGDWEGLVRSLLMVHYDPAYAASARKCYPRITKTLELSDMRNGTIDDLAAPLLRDSSGT